MEGFYKLSWLQRIGFGSGDLAQNLIFQTTCMYLLFFYTDIYGLDAVDVSVMFTIGNVANVIWDPIVGALIDKSNPRLGKYRAYLVFVGIPLSGFAILCFWNGFAPSLLYAYVTYISMTLLYTFINVPYGALNSSLTRDTNEITILTSVRMFMANCGGLAVGSGLPLLISYFTEEKAEGLPKDPGAWFTTMTIYAIIGLALLLFCFTQCKEKVVMDAKDSENVKISDLWMEFFHNRPLRILHDVNRQCSRCIFCKLQPAWYLRAIVRIHGLGFCSFIYFHAPCPNYKESCRKEEHVLHFLGSGNFWNGILICGF